MSTVEFIQIEPTTRCNFKCAFCPRRHLELGDMDYDIYIRILNEYTDVRYLQLYGEGEPLMHPLFYSMIREAKKRGITISTITNGSLLDNNIENILASGLNSVHISLESTDPATFKKIRGGDINNILNSIDILINRRNSNDSSTPYIGFSVTVLKETKDDLDQIFTHYHDMAMDGGIIIQPLNEMSSYTKNYNDEVHYQALENSELKMIDDKLYNNNTLNEIQKDRRLNSTFFEALRHNFNAERDGCPWLLRSLFINFSGYAMPCSMIKNIELYSFGNVGRDSMESVLEKRERMREQILLGNIPEACRNCRTLDPCYKPGKMYQYLDRQSRLPG